MDDSSVATYFNVDNMNDITLYNPRKKSTK